MIPQLLPFRHAAFQITWAWRAPINFLIMTQKSSRSCKKRHERVGKGKKLCCCGVRFFFLFPLMSFSWPESLKGHKKKTSSRTMKRAFKKAIKLPGRQDFQQLTSKKKMIQTFNVAFKAKRNVARE